MKRPIRSQALTCRNRSRSCALGIPRSQAWVVVYTCSPVNCVSNPPHQFIHVGSPRLYNPPEMVVGR